MAVGPVLLLLVLNGMIVFCGRRKPERTSAEAEPLRHDNMSPRSETTAEKDNPTDIFTLVLVSCLFLSCNVMVG